VAVLGEKKGGEIKRERERGRVRGSYKRKEITV
jgi:hypothetical protein